MVYYETVILSCPCCGRKLDTRRCNVESKSTTTMNKTCIKCNNSIEFKITGASVQVRIK